MDRAAEQCPDYGNAEERKAYLDGYADGFNGRARCDQHPLPNAYNRGYWTGDGDRA